MRFLKSKKFWMWFFGLYILGQVIINWHPGSVCQLEPEYEMQATNELPYTVLNLSCEGTQNDGKPYGSFYMGMNYPGNQLYLKGRYIESPSGNYHGAFQVTQIKTGVADWRSVDAYLTSDNMFMYHLSDSGLRLDNISFDGLPDAMVFDPI